MINYRQCRCYRRFIIGGVNDTADKHKAIVRNDLIEPRWNLRGPGETDSRKKPEVENLVLDSL